MRVIFIILLFVCQPVMAGNSLLVALSDKAKNIEQFKGSFVQNRKITILPLPLISKGEFCYHHKAGMIWNTLDPVQSKVQITSQGIHADQAGASSHLAGSAQLAKILLGIFSGNLDALADQFNILVDGDVTQWHLHLTPKHELVASQISAIDIRGKDTTESVAIAEANGDHTDLTFTTQQLVLFEN